VADHLHIGDQAILGAKAGVHKDVPAKARMLGAPATPDREQMRIMMSLERLPELRKDVKKIKQHLGLGDEG
jgi:UDP-3-O-[3-hydroxymyristoyl] glucosamine N-acyltransferase